MYGENSIRFKNKHPLIYKRNAVTIVENMEASEKQKEITFSKAPNLSVP